MKLPLPLLLTLSCASTTTMDRPAIDAAVTDGAVAADARLAVSTCSRGHAVDLLFVIDNQGQMALLGQLNLLRGFRSFLDALAPPTAPATSLRIGVISTDLGTPGSTVLSCANSAVGDDARLNPIRYGPAMRSHQPWTVETAIPRPARCAPDPTQYPSFLTFDAANADRDGFRDDFFCYGFLSGRGGCGIEQPLEAAYRALVLHDARETPGNRGPNAGFVRDDAVLAVVVLTDDDDGSVRDCRYATPGAPCTDATSVFDITNTSWADPYFNGRFYMYTPGSPQDPTWNLDRYFDPARPSQGLTAVKPGAPQMVVFGAIAGVPMSTPQHPDGTLDWDALLGTRADGSDGYVGMSPEGPVSMRQRNPDPDCSIRVVPSCRREGSDYDPADPPCGSDRQSYAFPSRRIAQVVRRFDERYQNGVLGSICRNDFEDTLRAVARRVTGHFCP